MKMKVTHYSIGTQWGGNNSHLRSWTLEGSRDGLNWVKLDDRLNDTSLNRKGAIYAFSISENADEAFQQIRLRQTGKNSSNNDQLIVDAIELFGVLNGLKR
jgi:hypothetical protein